MQIDPWGLLLAAGVILASAALFATAGMLVWRWEVIAP